MSRLRCPDCTTIFEAPVSGFHPVCPKCGFSSSVKPAKPSTPYDAYPTRPLPGSTPTTRAVPSRPVNQRGPLRGLLKGGIITALVGNYIPMFFEGANLGRDTVFVGVNALGAFASSGGQSENQFFLIPDGTGDGFLAMLASILLIGGIVALFVSLRMKTLRLSAIVTSAGLGAQVIGYFVLMSVLGRISPFIGSGVALVGWILIGVALARRWAAIGKAPNAQPTF